MARNNVLGSTNVYKPVGYEYKKGATADPVALGVGITFGVIGLVVIGLLIAWVVYMKKKRVKIYEDLNDNI